VLPVPGPSHAESRSAAAGVFPLVGALIGGLSVIAGVLAGWLWGDPSRGVCVLLTWAILSGGLHLDGLADSCDGLLSWQSRERKLEIMRDSRIGVMGTVGLFAILALQLAALLALGEQWWVGAFAAPIWGRWASSYGVSLFPSARRDGLGEAFQDGARTRVVSATLLALVLSGSLGVLSAAAVVIVAPITHVLALGISARLGGLTGDTYGALVETAQTVALLSLAALAHQGVAIRL